MSITTDRAMASLLNEDDCNALREIAGARAAFDAPLAPYTSWKIGGPADALLTLESEDELALVLQFARRRRVPWFVIGAGSNVLRGGDGKDFITFLSGDDIHANAGDHLTIDSIVN